MKPAATLPKEARASFKDPVGPVFTDATELLADAGSFTIAVGDVVTYHLTRAGAPPAVAVVDGRTEREAVDDDVLEGLPDADTDVHVASDPGTVSEELLDALVAAIDRAPTNTTLVMVDGEEDLATVPAVLAAPVDATVVYGQPGEGMVRANVTSRLKEQMRDLAAELETTDAFWAALE
ncbi:GTP-dependent dephospho-CoA kinase family protein [Halocalculus aciditolerans]|uniref:GTP-dependent dephospho-CoA kinase n=1 Tax=Halocalculus aciditolerans TaxID=1383812 RepID=A0A830FF83_9EURY|nr:GTP-dependent dephospho-CoA kinase family protein [Halocalculus aciditolerans]GGL49447.1 hypothetical protein GCM10009039_04570 [Halocalculus aciditolerans]